jgi:hypothetical protein
VSEWWDESNQRYRTNLVYKFFYVWTWPITRLMLFRFMSSERAHVFATHYGLPAIGLIDRVYEAAKTVLIVLAIIGLRLIAFLPGFSWDKGKKPTGSRKC